LNLKKTHLTLAQLTHHLFDFAASLAHSEIALRLTRALEQPEWIARTLNSLGYAHILLGHLDRGEPEMQEAKTIYVTLGNRAMEADCRTALAAIKNWQWESESGIDEARLALTISQDIDNPWGQIYSSNWLALGLLDRGDYEGALQIAQDARAVAQAHDFMPVAIFNALILGSIYRSLMQLDAAIAIHREVDEMNVQPGPMFSQIKAELCHDYAFLGDWGSALNYARAALTYRHYHELPLLLSPRWTETAALIRGGDTAVASEDALLWGKLVGHIPRLRVAHLITYAQ
jgi:tetratricopeptide (TPR) repeat protein